MLATSGEDQQAAVLADNVGHAEGDARSWPQHIAGIGKPLIVGLGKVAVVGAVPTRFVVNAI